MTNEMPAITAENRQNVAGPSANQSSSASIRAADVAGGSIGLKFVLARKATLLTSSH
jgi:hypothetical protein